MTLQLLRACSAGDGRWTAAKGWVPSQKRKNRTKMKKSNSLARSVAHSRPLQGQPVLDSAVGQSESTRVITFANSRCPCPGQPFCTWRAVHAKQRHKTGGEREHTQQDAQPSAPTFGMSLLMGLKLVLNESARRMAWSFCSCSSSGAPPPFFSPLPFAMVAARSRRQPCFVGRRRGSHGPCLLDYSKRRYVPEPVGIPWLQSA